MGRVGRGETGLYKPWPLKCPLAHPTQGRPLKPGSSRASQAVGFLLERDKNLNLHGFGLIPLLRRPSKSGETPVP